MPFFSLYDERAKPKGSRDPLGFELTWSHFGRRLVGNLTTITSSLANFKVALLGFTCVHELTPESDDVGRHDLIRERFLRYEQLAAYLRLHANSDTSILGITRAKSNLKACMESNTPLKLSSASSSQILSDQASYGLWGLYSSAMRSAGLVEGNDRTPTQAGHETVGVMSAQTPNLIETLQNYIKTDCELDQSSLGELASDFETAISHSATDKDLVRRLLTHTHDTEKVAALYETLYEATLSWLEQANHESSWAEWRSGFLAAIEKVSSDQLAQRATDIKLVAPVLEMSNTLFDYLRSQNQATLESIADELQQHSDALTSALPEQLPSHAFPHREFLDSIRTESLDRNFPELVRVILRHHEEVMKARGGAAWMELDGQQKLRVRRPLEKNWLPENRDDMTNRWDYDYFLTAYLNIARQVTPGNEFQMTEEPAT